MTEQPMTTTSPASQPTFLSASEHGKKSPLPSYTSVMNSGVSKAKTGRPYLKLSKALEEKLLEAVASPGAGMHASSGRVGGYANSLDIGLLESPLVSGYLDQDALPVQCTKRQLETTTGSDPLPAKRARLTTGDQQPSVEDGKAEQADKV